MDDSPYRSSLETYAAKVERLERELAETQETLQRKETLLASYEAAERISRFELGERLFLKGMARAGILLAACTLMTMAVAVGATGTSGRPSVRMPEPAGEVPPTREGPSMVLQCLEREPMLVAFGSSEIFEASYRAPREEAYLVEWPFLRHGERGRWLWLYVLN